MAKPLTSHLLATFKMAKVFQDHQRDVTSLDFDATGEYVLSTSEDESIRVYSCKEGKPYKQSYSKKYGCDLARFAHRPTQILYASTKEDDTIRYLSLHDNKYLRYFKGHTQRVVSLEVSPLDDLFLSGSMDDTVRLWDLRSTQAQGVLTIPSTFIGNNNALYKSSMGARPIVAFDPSGLVFAVAHHSSCVRLYDARNFDAGPFQVTEIPLPPHPQLSAHSWHAIKFSSDSKNLIVSTCGNASVVLDGGDASFKFYLSGHTNHDGLALTANFTPDGKYAFCGSQDGSIYFWDAQTGQPICNLTGHCDPVRVVDFNPRYRMFVSADTALAFWIPPYDTY